MHYVDGDGINYVSTRDVMESQYMRKRIAEQFGQQFNWKDDETRKTFEDNVQATTKKWKKYISSLDEKGFTKEYEK